MTTTETTQAHDHSFPARPPEGHTWTPAGVIDRRCQICGKTWELAQAEKAMAGALAAMEMAGMPPRPPVVCLCGSTKFRDEFIEANRAETMAGKIVLAPGVFGWSGDLAAQDCTAGDVKTSLDDLHKRKIDMADEVLVVSRDGYFGDSTASEIQYAVEHGKPVRFAERAAARRADEMDLFL